MKLTPKQLADLRAMALGPDGRGGIAPGLVVRMLDHIEEVEREHEQALSHWVDKCGRIGAERDRLKAALEKVAGMEARSRVYDNKPCGHCEAMIEAARKAMGK